MPSIKRIKNLTKNFAYKLRQHTRQQFFLKTVLPLIALLMLFNAILGLFRNPKRTIEIPQNPTSIAAFEHSVSGLGISEPKSEIIQIGTNISGIVAQVYVKAGDKIKIGDPLFGLDDRQERANLDLKIAQYSAAQLDAKEKQQEFDMYKKIADERAYSRDEFNKKKIAAEIYTEKAKQAKAEMQVAKVIVDQMLIKSPIDGEVLKVNIRTGEYAQAGALSNSLMTIGDISTIHLRVEIDESEAHLLKPENPAIAYLRGQPTFKIPLQFVRIEPYIVPKISISGGNAEKIDTRVLQAIYSFKNDSDTRIFIGQQFDVYIKAD